MTTEVNTLKSQIAEYQKAFTTFPNMGYVNAADQCVAVGNTAGAKTILAQLPTQAELLKSLTDKLRDKSVYKTLGKITQGKGVSKVVQLKGLCSLCTHIVIEIEQQHNEYRLLLPEVINKIQILAKAI